MADTFKNYRTLVLSAAFLVVAGLATLTWRQAATYGDIETLWRTTLARNPGCWMAHTNLGIVLFRKGKLDDAIAHYRTTLKCSLTFGMPITILVPPFWAKARWTRRSFIVKGRSRMQPNDPDAQVAFANALLSKETN